MSIYLFVNSFKFSLCCDLSIVISADNDAMIILLPQNAYGMFDFELMRLWRQRKDD